MNKEEIINEIKCRIDHGADSNGHLEGLLAIIEEKQKLVHRDPTKGFEAGDLISSQETGNLKVIEKLHEYDNRWDLVEFDDPLLGRLRALQEGEPLEMLGQRAVLWDSDLKTYRETNAPYANQSCCPDQYYMPIEAYRKWKEEQEEPKTRPLTFEELIPLVGTTVEIKDGGHIYYEPLRLHIEDDYTEYYFVGNGFEQFENFHKNVTRLDGTPFEMEYK